MIKMVKVIFDNGQEPKIGFELDNYQASKVLDLVWKMFIDNEK